MSLTVIIPSKTASNLVPCIKAVWDKEPTAPIIVVNDGIDLKEFSEHSPILAHAIQTGIAEQMVGLRLIQGTEPFVFARNCNLGIKAAGEADVILLNDDALLETPFGFHELEAASKAHPEFGLISAVTNVAGNTAQYQRDEGLREEPRTVAFICVYIPRKTIELVGLMDERFGGVDEQGRRIYGYCDNDYCRRVRNTGLKLGIFDDCYVDHGSLKSTFRGDARAAGDIAAGREIYRQKWGDCA